MNHIIFEKKNGIARLSFNNPKTQNALSYAMVTELSEHITNISIDDSINAVVFSGYGKHFSSGYDLSWLVNFAHQSEDKNYAEAFTLANLFKTIHDLKKIIITEIKGLTCGPALCLLAMADLAIASQDTILCFNDINLGINPTITMPYIIKSIGIKNAKRWCLSAENFGVSEAYNMGLIHKIANIHNLNKATDAILQQIIKKPACAIRHCKEFIADLNAQRYKDLLVEQTASLFVKSVMQPATMLNLKYQLEENLANNSDQSQSQGFF